MNSKPVFALDEVESDLRVAFSHYLSWRSDGKEHVIGLYDDTVSWIDGIRIRFQRSSEGSSEQF